MPRIILGCVELMCPMGSSGNPGPPGSDGFPGKQGGPGLAGEDGYDVQLEQENDLPCVICPSGPPGQRYPHPLLYILPFVILEVSKANVDRSAFEAKPAKKALPASPELLVILEGQVNVAVPVSKAHSATKALLETLSSPVLGSKVHVELQGLEARRDQMECPGRRRTALECLGKQDHQDLWVHLEIMATRECPANGDPLESQV